MRTIGILRLGGAAIAAALAIASSARGAHAQSSAELNNYRAAELPDDGFQLSGARMAGHLELAAQLHLDYARDPLVYEDVAGQSDSELVALVSDQMTTQLALALGLYDRATVYMVWPVNLLMQGEPLGDQPTATGFGSGDLRFGGRLALHRSALAAAALQVTVSAGTGERGDAGRPGVAGDGSATFEPEALGELMAGPLRLLANVGMRFREDTEFAGARFTDLLTFGVGAALPIVADRLQAHLELQGNSPLDDIGDRAGTPLQALLGLKLTPLTGFTFGLGGGAGLLRGYGSPDLRAVMMVGYEHPFAAAQTASHEPDDAEAPPEPAARPRAAVAARPAAAMAPPAVETTLVDADGDGVNDAEDRCATLPGQAGDGCPKFLRHDPKSGAIELLEPLRFARKKAVLNARSRELLPEIAAVLLADGARVLRIEAHVSRARETGLELSQERALAVAQLLVAEHGVAAAQLEAVGCGSERPIVPDRGSQRAKNERIELYLVRPLPPSGMRSLLACEEAPLPGQRPAEAAKPAPVPAPAAPAAKPAVAPVPPPQPAPKPAPAATPPPPRPAAPAPVAPPKPAPIAAPAPLPLPLPLKPKPAPLAAPAPAAAAPAKPAPVAPAPAKPAPAPAVPKVAAATTAAAVMAALAREPEADADRDGAPNGRDACPLAPGKSEGCPESHRVDLERGELTLLKPIKFEPAAAAVARASAAYLDELAATLKANAAMRVLIEAHVAEEAGAEQSLALTRKRADTVRSELVARGVARPRLLAYGCGEQRPIAPNNVPWGRKKNERVEVHVLDPAPASGVHSIEGCAASE